MFYVVVVLNLTEGFGCLSQSTGGENFINNSLMN